MNVDRTPIGAQVEVIEDWLTSVGKVQESQSGRTVVLTTEMLCDYAEWVAAWQREMIAQTLDTMDDGIWANCCGDAVRRMRAEH